MNIKLKHFDTLQEVLDWALQEMIYSAQDDDELDPGKLDDLLTLQAANDHGLTVDSLLKERK